MASLGDKAKSSVIWNTGFNVFRDLLQFGVMLVLVRLIAPEVYGAFALLTSIMTFIHVFSFNTVLQHVLQVRDDGKVNYQAHFTFGVFLQLGLFVFTNILALVFTYLEIYLTVSRYLHIMSVVFLLELFSELYRIQLQRQLDWMRMRILHGIGLLIGSGLAILIANRGGGMYALIIPALISNLPFIYEFVVTKKWRPTWYFKMTEYKETIRFSMARVFSGLTLSGKPLLENSLFVSILSYTELGFYNRAVGLATILVQKFVFQLTASIYPVLTRVEPYTDQFRRIGGLILQFTCWFIFPLTYGVMLFSNELVTTLYGNKWLDVIPYLGLAAVFLALSSAKHVVYSLLLSSHQARFCSAVDIVLLALSILVIFLILPIGVITYLYAQIGLMTAVTLFLLTRAITTKVIRLQSLFSVLVPPTLGLAMAHLTYWAILQFIPNSALPTLSHLVVYSSLIGLIYLGVIRILFQKDLISIVNYLPGKRLIGRLLLIKT